MLTKLTLTIDDQVVSKAKKYAQQKNKSISRMVEEYLDIISNNQTSLTVSDQLSSPITDEMVGIIKDSGKKYEDILEEALLDKYSWRKEFL